MGRQIDFILYFWSTTTKGPHLNSNFFLLFRVAHYGRLNATMTPIVFVIKRRKKNFLFSWQSRVLFHFCCCFFFLLLALQEKNAFYLPRFVTVLFLILLSLSLIRKLKTKSEFSFWLNKNVKMPLNEDGNVEWVKNHNLITSNIQSLSLLSIQC